MKNAIYAVKLLIIVLLIMSSCLYVFFYALFKLPDDQVRSSLHPYPSSQLLFEDQARYGADIAQRSLYYWSADSLNDVQRYYSTIFPPFDSGSTKRWLITAFNFDGTKTNTINKSSLLDHESFCNFRQPYECITLALIEANSKDLYRLPVVSPSNFLYLTPPPNFMLIPQKGTLMVYSYYIRAG